MAQIIKHRRGSVSALKDVTANVGELVMATGSIGDFNGPIVFIGDTAVAGGYKPVSKIYQGSVAPTISVGSHGSTMDGIPFYSTTTQTLYILDKSGNTAIDLTGNIEGNLISGVTINNLTGTTAYIANVSGSFTGSGQGLYNIPASGITGLELNRIASGSATASISPDNGLRINVKTEITGSLTVSGDTYTSGNVYITGNTSQTGSIDLTGNITLGGNITIGDQTTDIIQFGGEVSSSIVPDVHNAFDLGTSEKNWRNLHISGTAYVDTLQARQVNFNDLGILTDLTVSGSTYLGNGGDITVVSGSLYNDQLTDNRVLVAGPNGVIGDSQYFTYDEVTLRAGGFEVDIISGDTRTSGSLLVKGGATVTGSFNVSGSANIVGPVDVKGDTTVTGSFNVSGSANIVGLVDVKGDTTVTGSLGVSDSVYITNNLSVSGNVTLGDTISDNTIVSGTLYTHNTTNIGDTNTLFGTALIVSGAIKHVGDNIVDGNLIVSGNVNLGDTISDNTIISGTLYTHNTTYIGDTNTLFGTALIISGGVKQVGDSNIDGDVSITGSLITDGITNNGDLTVNGVLTVTGNTQLQSNLYVSGNLEVLGSSTNVSIQSQTVEIDDNIIRMNAYSPFLRYAGIEVMDSGSSGVSASMLWDSQNDYWMFVSGSGQSSKFIGTTYGTYGSEVSLTNTYFPIATGTNTIGDSLLRYSGTTLSFNTNKFTIDSGTGDTSISGNVTLSYSGGTDSGTLSSTVVFRNSSNVLGYVSSTDTQNVITQLLGYNNSTGVLEFSSVVDGGTY